MRTIRRSTRFDKHDLPSILNLLANDLSLPENICDHALIGDKSQYRDCHIKPDLVLIYDKPNPHELVLVRLGTHSQLDLS